MSTQANTGIPFSYSHSQSPIRLLELPPALLSLVTSSSPPIIKIKAAPTPANTTGPRGSENHAVLCTPTQTFSLRHVHCSNSILLVQPSEALPSLLSAEDEQAFSLTSTGLKAVATATSWLELIPVTPDCAHLLRERIPVYHGWTDDAPFLSVTQDSMSRDRLLDSIPVSDAEFSAAWDALLAFETEEGVACRPSPGAVLKTVSEINTSIIVESFSLSSTAGFTVPAILEMLDNNDIPARLVTAVIASICDRAGEGADHAWRLNVEKCCAFVGIAILQDWAEQVNAHKVKNDLLFISFMTKWKNAIPEECMGVCKLSTIKGWYTLPTANTIRYGPTGDAEAKFASGTPTTSAPAKPTMPAKNKWHERLGKKR